MHPAGEAGGLRPDPRPLRSRVVLEAGRGAARGGGRRLAREGRRTDAGPALGQGDGRGGASQQRVKVVPVAAPTCVVVVCVSLSATVSLPLEIRCLVVADGCFAAASTGRTAAPSADPRGSPPKRCTPQSSRHL